MEDEKNREKYDSLKTCNHLASNLKKYRIQLEIQSIRFRCLSCVSFMFSCKCSAEFSKASRDCYHLENHASTNCQHCADLQAASIDWLQTPSHFQTPSLTKTSVPRGSMDMNHDESCNFLFELLNNIPYHIQYQTFLRSYSNLFMTHLGRQHIATYTTWHSTTSHMPSACQDLTQPLRLLRPLKKQSSVSLAGTFLQ